MSKELEALEKVRNCLYPFASDNQKAFDVIENALKEKENIESRIDEIFSNHNIKSFVELNERLCDYNELKFDDDIKQMKLKALEIIKDKEVNVFIFLHSGDLETYNDMVEENIKLTQEEYDLLKEVLL